VKVAEYVARRLVAWGLDTCFTVTGGGAMHLNDAFGGVEGIRVRYMHHEQACAIAAEGYARVSGRPAIVNVTSGPGSLNAFNGVYGAFTDSVPMIVVAGQVRRDTNAELEGLPQLRQLGDQEARVLEMIAPITVWAGAVNDPTQVESLVDAAVVQATSGRPGPAWLEIPVDVQGLDVPGLDPEAPLPLRVAMAPPAADVVDDVVDRFASSRRPLILAGTGVRSAGVSDLLPSLARALGAPIATGWTHDTIATDDPYYAGRPGTIGTRAGNFILQSCDLLLVLGSRLNIRQVSYNWSQFAPDASIVWVDIDDQELTKPYIRPDVGVVADLSDFVPTLLSAATSHVPGDHDAWLTWCRDVRSRYEPKDCDYPVRSGGINAYHLVSALGGFLGGDHVVACGDATACIVPFQVLPVTAGMRLFSNSGSASMGYDLPAALGAATAAPERRIVCLAGDGSIMLNLQELQSLRAWDDLDVLLIVLDNGGYLSIKQTQQNFFGREFGASEVSGVTFPNFSDVAHGFGLPVTTLDPDGDWRTQLKQCVEATGSRVCVARLDRQQEFEPRLKSRMVDGVIRTPPLDDMFPHLSDDVLRDVRSSARQP
jgi:acetolactate synthase-1/2/3 large subunit